MAYHTAGIVGSYIQSTKSDGFMVAVGGGTNTIATSLDGITWTGRGQTILYPTARGVSWNGSLWLVAGEGTVNTLAYSADGITWTGLGKTIFTTGGTFFAWNGSLWVATGEGTNTIAYSADGINWTGLGTSIFSTRGRSVAWNGSLWVATGEGTNTMATSTDGINWIGVTSSPFTTAGYAVAWNGSLWVAGGAGVNSLAYSSNGTTWTGIGTSVFSSAGWAVAWNGSLWVAGGVGTNTLAYSSDGISWTGVVSSPFSTAGHGVAWNGTRWVAAGVGTNTLAYSSNGTTWTGIGASVFMSGGLEVASRQYVLPLVKSVSFDSSGGMVQYAGNLVGANTAASNQLGGVTLRDKNVTFGGFIRDASGTIDISGGNIYISGTLTQSGGGSTSNLVVPGYIRNAITPTTLDISGGNISNSGTTTSANALISGYLRNALVATQFDISGGNISNSATHTSSNFIGTAAASNQIGGVTLSNTNISNAGTTTSANVLVSGFLRNALTATQFDISGGNISNSLTTRSSNFIGTSTASNQIGGVTLSNTNLTLAGTITGSTASASNQIGGVTLSNTNLTLAGTITGSTTNTSNTVGGVTLSNQFLGVGIPGPTVQLDVSGLVRVRNAGGEANITMISGAGADATGFRMYQVSSEQGIYTSNTVPFYIYTGGSRRLTILSNGNTGIGTAVPATRLQVNPEIADDNGKVYDTSAVMFIQPTGTGTTVLNDPTPILYLGRQGASGQALGAMSTFKLSRFENGGTSSVGSRTRLDIDLTHNIFDDVNVMTMRSDGRVGIGTTAPTTLLDISGAGTGFVTAQIRNNAGQAGLQITGAGFTDNSGLQIIHNASEQAIYNNNTNPFYIWTRNARRFAIDQSGNTGIGTGTDGLRNYRLSIRGTGGTTAGIVFANSGNPVPFVGMVYDEVTEGLAFRVNTGTADVNCNAMFVRRGNGNVGINTTAPAVPLDVSSAAAVNFRTGNTSGYVQTGVASGTYGILQMNGGFYMYQPGTATTTNASVQIQNENNGRTFFGSGVGSYRVGICTGAPAYALDVSEAATLASINMSTWPRMSVSNVAVKKAIGTVGNTLNFSNTGIALSSSLITWDYSNATTGSSFVVLKSGIWSISAHFYSATNAYAWIDASTNNISNTAYNALGSPAIAFGGNGVGTAFSLHFTGYIPSNASMIYKVRISSALVTTGSIGQFFTMAFLSELPNAVTGYPNF